MAKIGGSASDDGANAINRQISNHGTQMHVQFLRVEDAILQRSDTDRIRRMKYWESITDNLSKATTESVWLCARMKS
jgi:hypothetical protein